MKKEFVISFIVIIVFLIGLPVSVAEEKEVKVNKKFEKENSIEAQLVDGIEQKFYNKKYNKQEGIILFSPLEFNAIWDKERTYYEVFFTLYSNTSNEIRESKIELKDLKKFNPVYYYTYDSFIENETVETKIVFENETFQEKNETIIERYFFKNYNEFGVSKDLVFNETNKVIGIKAVFETPRFHRESFDIEIKDKNNKKLILDPDLGDCGTINSPGIYTLNSSMTSTGTCITINSSDVIIQGNNFVVNFGGGVGIQNLGWNNVSIKNVTVNATNNGLTNILFATGSNNGIIENCDIYARNSGTGIFVNASNYLTIQNNFINGSSVSGIRLNSPSNFSSIISNNISSNQYTIYINGQNSLVKSNIISSTTDSGIYFTTSSNNNITNNNVFSYYAGIYLPYLGNNNTISYNKVYSSNQYGIYIKGNDLLINDNEVNASSEGIYFDSHTSQVLNNKVNSINDNGFEGYNITSVQILNNNFSTNDVNDNSIYIYSASVGESGFLTNNTFKNNNFSSTSLFQTIANSSFENNIFSTNQNYYFRNMTFINNSFSTSTNYYVQNSSFVNNSISVITFIVSNNNFITQNKISTLLFNSYLFDNSSSKYNTIINNNITDLTLTHSKYNNFLYNNIIGTVNFQICDYNSLQHNILNNSGSGYPYYSIYIASGYRTNNTLFENNTIIDNYNVTPELYINDMGNTIFNFTNQIIKNYSMSLGTYSGLSFFNFETQYGKIQFKSALSQNGTNLSDDVQISNGSIYVNSARTGFNKPANLTLYNTTSFNLRNPYVLKDGIPCNFSTCYVFNYGDTFIFNVTGFSNYTIGNATPGVENVSIFPSPAGDINNLSCNYSMILFNKASNNFSSTFRWFNNSVFTGIVSQNITDNITNVGESWKCEVLPIDNNSISGFAVNSSALIIGDSTPPIINYSLTNNVEVNVQTQIYVNTSDQGIIDYVYVEIEDPDVIKTNYTMVLYNGVNNGSMVKWNKNITPNKVGIWYIKFYSRDGSGNVVNTSDSYDHFIVSSVPVSSSGGGGSSRTVLKTNNLTEVTPNYIIIRSSPGSAKIKEFTIINKRVDDSLVDIVLDKTKSDDTAESWVTFQTTAGSVTQINDLMLPAYGESGGQSYVRYNIDIPKDAPLGNYSVFYEIVDTEGKISELFINIVVTDNVLYSYFVEFWTASWNGIPAYPIYLLGLTGFFALFFTRLGKKVLKKGKSLPSFTDRGGVKWKNT